MQAAVERRGLPPHAAAGQGEHVAAIVQTQLPPGGGPVRHTAELPPDGDTRSVNALPRQTGRLKLRRQRRMGDADAIQLQLTHAGGSR